MRRVAVVLALFAVSCAGDEEIEGDEAFECGDGADNDQDGYFDCQDNGCWNSPDCLGGGNDTGGGGGGNDSGGGGGIDCSNDPNGPFAHVNSLQLEMELQVTVDPENTFCSLLIGYGAVPNPTCTMTWTGSASNVIERCRPPQRVTLEGTFQRTASDCPPDPTSGGPGVLEQSTWGNDFNGSTGASHMSLIMDPDDPGYLDVVIGHKNLTDWEPDLETPVSSEQYFVYDMTNSAFAPGQTTISYTETATIAIENCPHTFVSTINGTINGG